MIPHVVFALAGTTNGAVSALTPVLARSWGLRQELKCSEADRESLFLQSDD